MLLLGGGGRGYPVGRVCGPSRRYATGGHCASVNESMPVASPSVVLPLRAAMELVTLEDILIEAVRLRPSIYDKTAAVYKNNKVREQEWKEVAQAVDMQGESVK
jgi:hypothetical protein